MRFRLARSRTMPTIDHDDCNEMGGTASLKGTVALAAILLAVMAVVFFL